MRSTDRSEITEDPRAELRSELAGRSSEAPIGARREIELSSDRSSQGDRAGQAALHAGGQPCLKSYTTGAPSFWAPISSFSPSRRLQSLHAIGESAVGPWR